MCGRASSRACTTGVLSPPRGSAILAGSLSIAVGLQFARVWVMCGRVGSRACTTGVLSPPRGSTVLFEDRVFSPLDAGITHSNSNG